MKLKMKLKNEIMIIDLEKLVKLESKYSHNTIAYNTLSMMVTELFNNLSGSLSADHQSYILASETLKELGILKEK
jgi:hypothetical protein